MTVSLAIGHVQSSTLLIILLSLPTLYFSLSYLYLARWHRKLFLGNTLIHENGRTTLFGSLFYFDHFVACVPMATLFSLCTVGGFALTAVMPATVDGSRAAFLSAALLGGAAALVVAGFFASIYTAGWQRTIDYALQRIERDGVMSRGGNWNQLQVSNVPIALGTIGVSSTIGAAVSGAAPHGGISLAAGGIACVAVAGTLVVALSMLNWCGWRSFLNPRWVAHGIREIATFPLTGVPISLAAVLAVEHCLSGVDRWFIAPQPLSLGVLGAGVAIMLGELLVLRNVNITAIAQRPSFAPEGLSIAYLLSSHVFEHFLDFVFIALLTSGTYALVRVAMLAS